MLHRALIALLAATSLTLAGCALSPQQLTPQPKLTSSLTPVGQGQPVVVRVVDGRSSPVLGTRGGLYPETSAISVSGENLLPKLQAEAEVAVRLLGFTPSANAYKGQGRTGPGESFDIEDYHLAGCAACVVYVEQTRLGSGFTSNASSWSGRRSSVALR